MGENARIVRDFIAAWVKDHDADLPSCEETDA